MTVYQMDQEKTAIAQEEGGRRREGDLKMWRPEDLKIVGGWGAVTRTGWEGPGTQ